VKPAGFEGGNNYPTGWRQATQRSDWRSISHASKISV